jgi:hypothetical protein
MSVASARYPRRLSRRRPRRDRRQWTLGDGHIAAAVALAFLALIVALMGHVLTRLDPVTGDEPFYLVTAGSILYDSDIDETNNWLARDVDAWLPPEPLPDGWRGWPLPARGFPPHASATIRDGLYSKHGLGVPVLIVGPMALGGRAGVVLLYGAIGALIAANCYLLARALAASPLVSLAVAGVIALTNPILSYSFLIFPELPAALCTVYAFRRLLMPTNTWLQGLGVGMAIAAVPWLHARLAPIAVALVVMLLVRVGQGKLRVPLLLTLAPPALSAAGLVAYYWYFYGRPWPNTQDHAGMTASLVGWSAGLIGLLLDQQWGLLMVAPIYVLVGAGVVALARTRPDVLLWWSAAILPYYALVGAYNQWWGEWCPPARYLAPVVPLAAAPLAALWAQDRTRITTVLVTVLAVPSLAIMALFMINPRLMYNHPIGQSQVLAALARRDLTDPPVPLLDDLTPAFPSFVVAGAAGADSVRLWWIVGLVALVVLTTLATWEAVGTPAERGARSPH